VTENFVEIKASTSTVAAALAATSRATRKPASRLSYTTLMSKRSKIKAAGKSWRLRSAVTAHKRSHVGISMPLLK